MSIVQTQTTSFKAELYQGVHNLLTDTLKIALYDGFADLNQSTTVYTSTNELPTANGYVQDAKVLTGVTVQQSGFVAYVNFDNVVWNPAAFTTRCALIYNASKGNKSIVVLDFGSNKTCNNTFTIQMPVNGPTTALIRSAN
jgi:hypothetical protein